VASDSFFDHCICGILLEIIINKSAFVSTHKKNKITPSTPNQQKEEGETEIQTELKKQMSSP